MNSAVRLGRLHPVQRGGRQQNGCLAVPRSRQMGELINVAFRYAVDEGVDADEASQVGVGRVTETDNGHLHVVILGIYNTCCCIARHTGLFIASVTL